MMVHTSCAKFACLALVMSLKSVHGIQSIFSARALAEFSWTTDDDATLLLASDLYQFQNVASTFFGELLDAWLALGPGQAPLTTKVTISGQQLKLSPTGENMEFRFPSVVDLTYIGEEEIPSLASTLAQITEGQEIPANLTSKSIPSTFTVTFSDPPTGLSTVLYTVRTAAITLEEITTDQEIPVYLASRSLPSTFTTILSDPLVETNSTTYTVQNTDTYTVQNTDTSQTSLVVTSFILAAAAFIVALLILLWAVGCFDKWKSCKTLRSRFYVHSSPAKLEHEIIAKSTSDSTQDGTTGIVVHEMVETAPDEGGFEVSNTEVVARLNEMDAQSHDACEVSTTLPNEGNFEESNTKVVVRIDEMDAESRSASVVSPTLPIVTCTTDLKWTSDRTVDGNGDVEAILESYFDAEFDEATLHPGQSTQARHRFGSKRKKKNLMRMLAPSRSMADSFSMLPFGSEDLEALSPMGRATVMSDFSEMPKGLLDIISASRTDSSVCQSEEIKTAESILADLLICQCEEEPVTNIDESTAYSDGTGTIFSNVAR